MTTTRQHFEFIKAIWDLFLQTVPTPFEKRFMHDWVSEQVFEKLGRETSVEATIQECRTEQDIEDSFKATVARLNRDWDRVLLSHKDRAIKLIKRFGLNDDFNVPLELSDDELEELSIRWDLADMFYAEARRQTLEECRKLGFDLENRTIDWQVDGAAPSMPVIVNRWTDLFFELLRAKMDFDLAVIKTINPTARYRRYKTQAKDRCREQLSQMLEELREFLLEDDMRRTHPDDVPTKGERVEAMLWTVHLTKPFETKSEQFLAQADKREPNPLVYERVAGLVRREMTPRAQEIKFMIGELNMADVYKNAGQAGAMGPNAHVHHMNFVQLWQQASEQIDLPSLATELSKLRETLVDEATTAEHYAAIGAVASAEVEAKQDNGPQALEYLSKAGKWTLDTATKIGVVVAASAIKTALGMP